MRVPIDDTYVILTDTHNFVLAEVREQGENTKEPGKLVDNPVSYHTKLEDVLKGYRKTKALKSDAESMKELRELLSSIDETIKKIAAELEL